MSSEIVIGIDYGTTYSGVSWAVNGGTKLVRVITNWPNPSAGRNPNSEKVPSIIAYDNGCPSKWGYDVGDGDQSFRWIKILLEPESEYSGKSEQVKQSNELLEQINKQAVDVVADYLAKVWEYAMKEIARKQGANFRDSYTLKVVMSVPAMWTPVAKEKTLQAAKQAGLGTNISLITEPEAAARATLKDKDEMQELKPGDCFVVCDAGGGTVDLISYEVQSLQPLVIKECAIGIGDLCGSAYLDMGFQKWVKTQIGESQWKSTKLKAKRKMVSDFELSIKRRFDLGGPSEHSVELRGIEDDPKLHIRDEMIIIKSTVIQTIFDHVCSQVDQLVRQQVRQVTEKKKRVKAILLVGGFGESGYLHDYLNDAYSHDGISVLQVNGAWSAICRGATMWGLENSSHFNGVAPPQKTVAARIARYSYGISCRTPFKASVHKLEDRVWSDAHDEYRADNQMIWLIRRGDEFEDDQILTYDLHRSVDGHGVMRSFLSDFVNAMMDSKYHNFEQKLLYSSEKVPPTRSVETGVKVLCDVAWSLYETDVFVGSRSYKNKTGKKFRNIEFKVTVRLGNADLSFGVVCGDETVVCEAKYPED